MPRFVLRTGSRRRYYWHLSDISRKVWEVFKFLVWATGQSNPMTFCNGLTDTAGSLHLSCPSWSQARASIPETKTYFHLETQPAKTQPT